MAKNSILSTLTIGLLTCAPLLITGCGDTEKSTADSKPGTASGKSTTASVNYHRILPQPDDLSVKLADADRPSTQQEFVATFERLFKEDPYRAIIDLTYWGDADEREKRLYLFDIQKTLVHFSDGRLATLETDPERETFSWDIVPPDAENYFPVNTQDDDGDIVLTPAPTALLQVTFKYSENTRTFMTYAVGKHEGKLYFCTVQDNWKPQYEAFYDSDRAAATGK